MDNNKEEERLPLVVGVSILDITMSMKEDLPSTIDGAMYYGKSAQSAGGVGRNLAESIYKLFGKVNFVSLIGDDIIGEIMLNLLPEPLRHNIVKLPGSRTSSCTVMVDKAGDCKLILGDMEIHNKFHAEYISRKLLHTASVVIIDANLPIDTIHWILKTAREVKVPVFYEPTDLRISGKPFYSSVPHLTNIIRLITPNYAELQDIVRSELGDHYEFDEVDLENVEATLESVKRMLKAISHMFDCIVVTLGQAGIVLSLNYSVNPFQQPLFIDQKYIFDPTESTETSKRIIFFPTPIVEKNVVSVSGAGDSFAGGFISGLLKEYTVSQSIGYGFHAAREALKTEAAVPKEYFPPGWEDSDFWLWRMEDFKTPSWFGVKIWDYVID